MAGKGAESIRRIMLTNNLIIHYSEGKYECPLCHRKFNVFNKIKKNIWERRTLAGYISNRPNAERHLKSCEEGKKKNRSRKHRSEVLKRKRQGYRTLTGG